MRAFRYALFQKGDRLMKKSLSILSVVYVCAAALLTAAILILGKKEEANLLYITPAVVGVIGMINLVVLAALERKEGAANRMRRLDFFQLSRIVFVLVFTAMTVMNYGRIVALWALGGFLVVIFLTMKIMAVTKE